MKTCSRCNSIGLWYSGSLSEIFCDEHTKLFPNHKFQQYTSELSSIDMGKISKEINHRANFIEAVCANLEKTKQSLIKSIENFHEKTIKRLQEFSLSLLELLVKSELSNHDIVTLNKIMRTKISYKKPDKKKILNEMNTFYAQDFWIEQELSKVLNYNLVQALQDIESNHGLYTEGNGGGATAITVSNDGKFLVVGCKDSSIRIWSLHKKYEKCILRADNVPDCLAITSDNKYILSGGSKGLQLWNFELRKYEGFFKGDIFNITSIRLTHSDRYAVVCCSKENNAAAYLPVSVCSLETKKEIFELSDMNFMITCADVCQKGDSVISGCSDNIVRIWNFKDKHLKATFEGHTKVITGVTFTYDSRFGLSCSQDQTIRIWNLSKLSLRSLIQFSQQGNNIPRTITVSNDSQYLFIGCHYGNIVIWDFKNKKREINNLSYFSKPVKHVVVTPDDTYLLSCGETSEASPYNESVKIWNLKEQKLEKQLQGHLDKVTCFAYTSDFNILITGSADHTLRMWNVETRFEEFVFIGHKESITCIAISSNDKHAVSGSEDLSLRLWSLKKCLLEGIFDGHTCSILKVCFTNDYAYIASCNKNGKTIIWNIEERKKEASFKSKKSSRNWIDKYPEIQKIYHH